MAEKIHIKGERAEAIGAEREPAVQRAGPEAGASRAAGAVAPGSRTPSPRPGASAEAGGGQVWFPASPTFLRLPVSAP